MCCCCNCLLVLFILPFTIDKAVCQCCIYPLVYIVYRLALVHTRRILSVCGNKCSLLVSTLFIYKSCTDDVQYYVWNNSLLSWNIRRYSKSYQSKSKQANSDLQFKVLTVVSNKTVVFWDVMQYTDFSEVPIPAMLWYTNRNILLVLK